MRAFERGERGELRSKRECYHVDRMFARYNLVDQIEDGAFESSGRIAQIEALGMAKAGQIDGVDGLVAR